MHWYPSSPQIRRKGEIMFCICCPCYAHRRAWLSASSSMEFAAACSQYGCTASARRLPPQEHSAP
ncbi:hypothetical protein PILCRDRAFT_815707 [Piloderma croceum F 1598]|uniref:Uncharacterized protein n=1 Tax=Piloderma croceum (strain F 1598) TaxID=765440 RepID=A0A0C3G620_PILCF|nr:hypothetical protein PILCRDRAFT_815707 [Piloderma croceum F 1598]